jgi:GMP synthase-like glutamine amidotransferase
MIVFIDYERADGYEREYGRTMLAGRTRITYRLEDLAGTHCHLVRYDRVDQALLDKIGATAIFISGNSFAPDDYDPQALEPIHTILRETELPVFGFCGGFQLIAQALGAAVVALPPPDEHHADPSLVTTKDGRPFEYGYYPIELSVEGSDHPLLSGLGDQPTFRHAHGLHVPVLPDGFTNLASTTATPIQMAVHNERQIVGTQFHPEYWTDEHADGRTVIANFLSWSGWSPS